MHKFISVLNDGIGGSYHFERRGRAGKFRAGGNRIYFYGQGFVCKKVMRVVIVVLCHLCFGAKVDGRSLLSRTILLEYTRDHMTYTIEDTES